MRGPSNVEEQPFGYGITNGSRGSLRNLSGILMTLDRMTLKRGQRWSMRANVYSLVKPEIHDRTNDLQKDPSKRTSWQSRAARETLPNCAQHEVEGRDPHRICSYVQVHKDYTLEGNQQRPENPAKRHCKPHRPRVRMVRDLIL